MIPRDLIGYARMQGGDRLPARVADHRWLYVSTDRRISRGDYFTFEGQPYMVVAVLLTHGSFQKFEVVKTIGYL